MVERVELSVSGSLFVCLIFVLLGEQFARQKHSGWGWRVNGKSKRVLSHPVDVGMRGRQSAYAVCFVQPLGGALYECVVEEIFGSVANRSSDGGDGRLRTESGTKPCGGVGDVGDRRLWNDRGLCWCRLLETGV
jgi:hypothetical protein